MKMRKIPLLTGLMLLLKTACMTAHAEIVPVKVNRALYLQQMNGPVRWHHARTNRQAKVGDRLEQIGDALSTGRSAAALLKLDSNIGTINVGQNTTVKVQELNTTSSGGRITHLQVTGGRVRLKVRRFTQPSSRLEIHTPAGISGVRGTEFGVAVQPSGMTSIATLHGQVAAMAEGQEVLVDPGYQSLIVPGEPPSPPTRIENDPKLEIQAIELTGWQQVRVVGRTTPGNIVELNQQPISTDRSGNFDVHIPMGVRSRLEMSVTTSLEQQRVYETVVSNE